MCARVGKEGRPRKAVGRPVQWKVKTGRSVKTGNPSGKVIQLKDKAGNGVCERYAKSTKVIERAMTRSNHVVRHSPRHGNK